METSIALLLLFFAVMFILEILNATYQSFLRGFVAMTQIERVVAQRLPLRSAIPVAIRRVFARVMRVAQTVSLFVHELSHAFGHFLTFGKPRIVFCKNGGFAQSSPWFNSKLATVPYFYGYTIGYGVVAMAPLLFGGFLLFMLFIWLSGLPFDALATQASVLSSSSLSVVGTLEQGWVWLADCFSAAATGGWWQFLVIWLVAFLLAPGLTPSSVDFAHARYHLLAYVLAFVTATTLMLQFDWAGWALVGIAIAGLIVYHPLMLGPRGRQRRWPALLGAYAMTSGLIGLAAIVGLLGEEPLVPLQRGLAALNLVLILVAGIYFVLMLFIFLMSIVSLHASPIKELFRAVPQELKSVFTTFNTCPTCKIHFKDTCDGCGRTAEQIAAGAAG